MKKQICLSLAFIIIIASCLRANACRLNFRAKQKQQVQIEYPKPQAQKDFELLPTTDTISNAKNQVWVGTFQIVWNDLVNELLRKPVEFVGYNSEMAASLNKQAFDVNEISENSYYKKWGATSPDMKKEIEEGILKKFNETSDILDSMDWTPAIGKYILYAMLKKDFEYLKKFDKLPDGKFFGSEGDVKYFGVNKDTAFDVKNSIKVLFYNDNNDYAVSLQSKQGDIIYLYRTDEDKTFDNYYQDIITKSDNFNGKKYLTNKDEFKAPMLDFKSEATFPELCGKVIKDTNFVISDAIETIQFKMDEAGVKLKSEAAIMVQLTCAPGYIESPRYFYFNNKYVIFIQEDGKKPYLAIKVSDAKNLQK